MRGARLLLFLIALAAAGTTQPTGAAASLGTAPPTASAGVTPTWEPGVPAARAYAKRRAGVVSFAVRTRGVATGFRSLRPARSASVVKAMLLVAYLNRPGVRGRALTEEDRALLRPMIRYSDNVAANRVSALVGLDGLARLGRRAKMRAFVPSLIWGASQITAGDQARFFEHIDARIARRHRAYAMGLLRSVVPSQRWGIARVKPPKWTLYFKGGWYPGVNAVDHQAALLERGSRRVAVAILISGSPSQTYAHETLRGVSLRLLRGIDDLEAKAPSAPPPAEPAEAAPPATTWTTLLGAGWLSARGQLGLALGA